MVRFPEARGGRAIAQLPQNFSRLRRAIQSLYVFFHITKISSISFLLRHIWRTPPPIIFRHIWLTPPLEMT